MEERQKAEADHKIKNNDTRKSESVASGHVARARTAGSGNWVNTVTSEEVYSLMASTHSNSICLPPPNTNNSFAKPTVSNAFLSYGVPKIGRLACRYWVYAPLY